MNTAGRAVHKEYSKSSKFINIFTRVTDENNRNSEKKDFDSDMPVCWWYKTH